MKEACAVILAAGSARRMDLGRNKVFLKFDHESAVVRCVRTFFETGLFATIIVACREADRDVIRAKLDAHVPEAGCLLCLGGAERQDSVRSALALVPRSAGLVAVHDAARCFVTPEVIWDSMRMADAHGSGVAAIAATDTIKRVRGGIVERTLDRSRLVCVQTPQAFDADLLRRAYEKAEQDGFVGTDDASLVERLGATVHISRGSNENIKITVPSDIAQGERIAERRRGGTRVGTGFDAHAFCEGRPLVLGGVVVPYERGLAGHSDADVLAHAVMDAILGAAGLPDIGRLFPDTDPAYENCRSMDLLAEVGRMVAGSGLAIRNIDSTLLLERPKVAPFEQRMESNMAEALGIGADRVHVKATTLEGLGAIGRGEGAAAQAACLLERTWDA